MSVIELSGLISDDLILYNRIINMFYKKMNSVSLTGLVNCDILIDKIILQNSNNCRINIVNQCLLNSQISLTIFLETLIDNKDFMSENTIKKIEKYMGVVLNKTIDQNNTGFMKRCNISSDLSNSIKVKQLVIKNCYGETPLNFDFYNTGDATANCGFIELLNAVGKTDIDEEEKKYVLESVLGINFEDWIKILISIIIITFVLLFISSLTQNGIVKRKFIENI